MVFSIFIALNRLPWVLVQSLDLKPCPNSLTTLAATCGDW
ncbi:Uncharacterised protein [Pseudomonas aeruginosa]|nr:Uncharacterised protein [Pseudomonas aeruginosa]